MITPFRARCPLTIATPAAMTAGAHPEAGQGCGGRPGRVELLTGIEGASKSPVRRIVLIDG